MEKYIVEINKEDKKINGTLYICKSEESISFNPTNILCDLEIYKYNDSSDDIVLTNYNEEKAFPISIKIDKHKDVYYYSLVKYIKNKIINNKIPTLKEIEQLKLYFDIRFNYSISYKVINNKTGINKFKKSSFEYIPLQYGFSELDKINEFDAHKYIYNCYSLTDVIFCILHYLVMNNYNKIKKCNHCNMLFFYNHEKQIYCRRNSPYENYTHLDCEQAVRNIKKKLADRKKSIYNTLTNCHQENLYKFMDDWDELRIKVDECSSVENLKELEIFSKKSNIRERYYKNN